MDDVIDMLAGIEPGSALDRIRAGREQARQEAQASFRALFEPADAGDVPVEARLAVATFVAGLHGQPEIEQFYRARLGPGLHGALDLAAQEAKGQGPYGSYPPGPLSREDVAGPRYHVSQELRTTLGRRLTAALEHAHMLVFHPRDAAPEPLAALLDAGWSTTAIVTLSQLVAFLSYQIRAVAGLRVLALSRSQ
jgi:CMD domain protein